MTIASLGTAAEIYAAVAASETAGASTATATLSELLALNAQQVVKAGGQAAAGAFSQAETALLKEFFGTGARGAVLQLSKLRLPPGMTPDLLLRYAALARALVEAGLDKVGTQAARLKLIEEALKECK